MGSVGQAVISDRVARFAREADDPRLVAIARAAARPVTVTVRGRPGVGHGSVARALTDAGVPVCPDGDVDVYVVAEVVKPEDHAAIGASTLLVQNKADLCAAVPGSVPMIAHLALARLDEAMVAELRLMAAGPCELGSIDDVVTGPIRALLLETLDLSGIAEAIRAVRAGSDVRRALWKRSGVDGVVAALTPMLAEAAYRRARSAAAALEAIAATDGNLATPITDFLRCDDTVLGFMAAAVEVMQAAGMIVDPGDSGAAHLRRATLWDRYRREPVGAMQRSCAGDIVRGSLRLWDRVRS